MVLVTLLLVVLSGVSSVVPRSAFERVVEQYIRARLPKTATEVAVEFRNVPDGLQVEGYEYALRVSESTASELKGNISLPVEIVVAGRVEHQCIVSIKVRTFDSVLVAARQLGRHESITSGDIRPERVETTALKGVPLRSVADLVGLRTKRIVRAGSVLTNEITQTIPDVLQGSAVKLIVKGKNFCFSVDAVAKDDGVKGQLVTVQRAGSSARVQATVMNQNSVEMRIQ
jgi:flagellar basal body P-ring formation protein FlgA